MRRPLIEHAARPEVAVLFGSVDGGRGGRAADPASEPLAELAGLAEAADVVAAGRLVQRLVRPTAATYLGSGKVEELAELARSVKADLAIADMDLTPAQARNLERALGLRVVDRSELIMDIFARRARTAQAQTQVELAQLQYALPRLRGQWRHLDRYRGGVGTRGPGEKQLETDRRLVQLRIQDLKSRLAAHERRKRQSIAGRVGIHTVALAGYTNTGKSTLFNALTGAEVYTANRLFATLDTRTRRWELPGGEAVLLSDTVGFVRRLPHHLVASFHATLEEVVEADLILHVVDATDSEAASRVAAVEDVIRQIGAGQVPTLTVLNKVDAVTDTMQLQALLNRQQGALRVSARTGQGLDALSAAVERFFSASDRRFRISIPAGDGRSMARLREMARVLSSEAGGEDSMEFEIAVDPQQAARLRAWARVSGFALQRA